MARPQRGITARLGICMCLLVAALLASARADEIELDNGDVITGRVLRMTGGRLVIETEYAGEINISKSRIRRLVIDEPVEVRLRSGETLKGRLESRRSGRWRLESTPERPAIELEPSDIEALNPPPPAWRGEVMAAAASQRGAGSGESVAVFGVAERRSRDNRTTFKMLFDYEHGGAEVFTRKIYVQTRNDYFYAPKFFAYVDTEQFSDELQGVNFRTLSGVGAGWQFLDRHDLSLRLEGGLAYAGASLVESGSENFVTGQLGGAVAWQPAGWLAIGEEFTVWPSLRENKALARSEAFLRVPISEHWSVKLVNVIDYDSRPPVGRHSDRLWLLGVAVRF